MFKKYTVISWLLFCVSYLYAQDTTFIKKNKAEKKELTKGDKKAYKKTKHQAPIHNLYIGYGFIGGTIRDEWNYRFSVTKTQLLDSYEVELGVTPNFPIWMDKIEEQSGIDSILEEAINQLSK